MLIIAFATAQVSASPSTLFDGKQVRLELDYPTFGTAFYAANATVGSAVEFPHPVFAPYVDVDFTDTTVHFAWITSNFFNSASFNGYWIRDIDGTIPKFVDVRLDPITNLVGMSSSRIFFDADNIVISMAGLSFTAETVMQINVNSVPEPTSPCIVLLGAIGVANWRNRSYVVSRRRIK